MAKQQYERLRTIALALPEVTERISHRAPCFYVRDKKPLCYFHETGGGTDRVSMWAPARPGVAQEMVDADPDRFFRPQPSASGVFSTWIGVFLDTVGDERVDWTEIEAVLDEAYRLIAPKKLIAQLDDR